MGSCPEPQEGNEMNKDYLERLHPFMFDDGAGDASFSTEGDSDSSAKPAVVYGKAEAGEEEGQVGTDTEGDGLQEEPDPEAEFEELIKGQYADQFNSRVQGIIQQRFKNAENYQDTIASYDKAVSPLYMIYGLKPGDVQGLEDAIKNDEGLYAARADEAGITARQYKENLRLRMEAAQGRSMREEMQRQAERQRTFNRWEQEARELKETFPAFDFTMELENPDFAQKLNTGYSVRDAFMATHMSDILSGMKGEVKTDTARQMVDNFRLRQSRPAENAASHAPAVVRKTDPSKWTDEDFDEVEKRVEAGEIIRL